MFCEEGPIKSVSTGNKWNISAPGLWWWC